jgi:hypothetical protein
LHRPAIYPGGLRDGSAANADASADLTQRAADGARQPARSLATATAVPFCLLTSRPRIRYNCIVTARGLAGQSVSPTSKLVGVGQEFLCALAIQSASPTGKPVGGRLPRACVSIEVAVCIGEVAVHQGRIQMVAAKRVDVSHTRRMVRACGDVFPWCSITFVARRANGRKPQCGRPLRAPSPRELGNAKTSKCSWEFQNSIVRTGKQAVLASFGTAPANLVRFVPKPGHADQREEHLRRSRATQSRKVRRSRIVRSAEPCAPPRQATRGRRGRKRVELDGGWQFVTEV